MRIQFVWPAGWRALDLEPSLTLENAAVFDVISGQFNVQNTPPSQDTVAFYWYMTRPMMMNLCEEAVCLLDGIEVAYGSIHPLREASSVQAGHFQLLLSHDYQDPDEFIPLREPLLATVPPEIEEILPNAGNCVNDLRYVNDVIAAKDKGDDILKTLEVEYKRFLIWQEQGQGELSDHHARLDGYIIKTDSRFDQIREQIKEKTLTECIVDSHFLIEKVWAELDPDDRWSEFFIEDKKIDLLHALSPELSIAKNKPRAPVSELIFHDVSKAGLDSYY